ncbi:MAG TPA: Hsp20/alpha crystallin family protein [Candidatus Saccharimonadales bacterium]|nr:Hsp20/alpha crystallin family protein [Candidatus Saccharimonadales bacterium]
MSNLVRFDPFAEIQALQKQLFTDDWFSPIKSMQMPTMDVYTSKDDKELHIEAHLPNFDQKDIDIHIDKGSLVIRAERHEQEKDKDKKYIVRESSTSFYRNVHLPEAADENSIKATMKDGVLKIAIKFKQLPKPKQIAIEA